MTKRLVLLLAWIAAIVALRVLFMGQGDPTPVAAEIASVGPAAAASSSPSDDDPTPIDGRTLLPASVDPASSGRSVDGVVYAASGDVLADVMIGAVDETASAASDAAGHFRLAIQTVGDSVEVEASKAGFVTERQLLRLDAPARIVMQPACTLALTVQSASTGLPLAGVSVALGVAVGREVVLGRTDHAGRLDMMVPHRALRLVLTHDQHDLLLVPGYLAAPGETVERTASMQDAACIDVAVVDHRGHDVLMPRFERATETGWLAPLVASAVVSGPPLRQRLCLPAREGLRVSAAGFASAIVSWSERRSAAVHEDGVPRVEVVLAPGATLLVRATDGDRPVAASVEVRAADRGARRAGRFAFGFVRADSDAQGLMRIDGLARGLAYEAVVHRSGSMPVRREFTIAESQELADLGTLVLASVDATPCIAGRVTDARGAPIGDVRVAIDQVLGDPTAGWSAQTAADGALALPAPSLPFRLRAERQPYCEFEQRFDASPAEWSIVLLEGVPIRGVVVDDVGERVPFAQVLLSLAAGRAVDVGADAAGRFESPPLCVPSVDLVPSAPGYRQAGGAVSARPGDDVRLELSRCGLLQVIARGPDGAAPAVAWEFEVSRGAHIATVHPVPAGQDRLAVTTPVGSVVVHVNVPGHPTRACNVAVRPFARTEVEITLQDGDPVTLRFDLPSGAPASGVEVLCHAADGESIPMVTFTTDVNGMVQVGLARGEYRLAVTQDGLTLDPGDVLLRVAGPVQRTLRLHTADR